MCMLKNLIYPIHDQFKNNTKMHTLDSYHVKCVVCI